MERAIICPTCEGEGGWDEGPKCGWSCEWCGGCFEGRPCDRCEGTGEVEATEEDCLMAEDHKHCKCWWEDEMACCHCKEGGENGGDRLGDFSALASTIPAPVRPLTIDDMQATMDKIQEVARRDREVGAKPEVIDAYRSIPLVAAHLHQDTPHHYGGVPVYQDPAVPLTRTRDGITTPVDYMLINLPQVPQMILVHPSKWDTFLEAIKMANELLKDKRN